MNFQNYNRYSYVLNNPMSMTDPSGYFFERAFGPALRDIASVPLLNAVITGAINFIPGCQTGICAAIYAGASTYAVTGSLGASVRTGLTSYISAQVLQEIGASEVWGKAGSPENIFANAMVGGISAELQGGKFGHGFFAAGFTTAAKPVINTIGGAGSAENAVANGDVQALAKFRVARVMAAAIVGGNASVIAGGKFANGAVTGAMMQMFNAESSNKRRAKAQQQRLARAKEVARKKGGRFKTIEQLKSTMRPGDWRLEIGDWRFEI